VLGIQLFQDVGSHLVHRSDNARFSGVQRWKKVLPDELTTFGIHAVLGRKLLLYELPELPEVAARLHVARQEVPNEIVGEQLAPKLLVGPVAAALVLIV
jgi:hypothetical protein